MIVNSGFQETRVAIVENGRLTDVYMEKHAASQIVGNVYKGKIIDVVPGMQAVFVDIGLDKNAYLPVDEPFSRLRLPFAGAANCWCR